MKFLALFICLMTTSVFAQSESSNDIIFGFNVGVNHSNLKVKMLPDNIGVSNGAGGRMGVIAEKKIGTNLAFSPKAAISFNSGALIVKEDGEAVKYGVMSTTLETMMHLMWTFKKSGAQPYVLVGPNMRIPMQIKTPAMPDAFTPDVAIDFGVGLDKKLTHFNFAPEVRYSIGIRNLSQLPELYSLVYHTVTLVFNFKG